MRAITTEARSASTRTMTSETPASTETTLAAATSAAQRERTRLARNRRSACTTTASTTGCSPARIAETSRREPPCTYAIARTHTSTTAGTMNDTPAAMSPGHPARR